MTAPVPAILRRDPSSYKVLAYVYFCGACTRRLPAEQDALIRCWACGMLNDLAGES